MNLMEFMSQRPEFIHNLDFLPTFSESADFVICSNDPSYKMYRAISDPWEKEPVASSFLNHLHFPDISPVIDS